MTSPCFSPRVVGTRRADSYDLDTFLAFPAFRGKTGEALALALYDYLTSPVDGLYHGWPPCEVDGEPRLRGRVEDPLKLLNAYGWAICGQSANLANHLYTRAGLPARQFGAPGHCLCEVFYDGRWHVLDTDMWTWFRTPEGPIASAFELARRPRALIVENAAKSNPCNLPDRNLEDYAGMYAKLVTADGEPAETWPDWRLQGHTMDFHLRPGETLVRSQASNGRFCMPQNWKANLRKFDAEWKGHPRERYAPFRSFGNGLWIYEPDLARGAADFLAGLWERGGLAADGRGVAGPGHAVVRLQSPYPFCGIPDWSGERVVHREGASLDLAGSGPLRLEALDAEGTWVPLGAWSGPFRSRVDLTGLLVCRYGTQLRVALDAGARLERWHFLGHLLTAPVSLPRLAEGKNPMTLRWGDRHGLGTVPWSTIVDFRGGASFAAQGLSVENGRVARRADGWQRLEPVGEGPLRVVLRGDAPAGRPFAWAYAHATVQEGAHGTPDVWSTLEWSADGSTWQELARRDHRNTRMHWDYSLDGSFRTPGGVRTLWIRVTSVTPVQGLQFHGHLLEPCAAGARIEVTHTWQEDGGERRFTAPAGAASYGVTCGPNPRAHTIRVHAPAH